MVRIFCSNVNALDLIFFSVSPDPNNVQSPGFTTAVISQGCDNNSVSRADMSISNNVLSRNSNNASHDPSSFLSRTNSIVGTLEYMAPEVVILFGKRKLHKEGYTASADFWSLGVMIFKLLTGLEPFKRFSYDAVRSILPAHLSKYSGYRSAFDALFGVVEYNICDGLLNENTRNMLQALLEFHDGKRLGFSLNNLEAAHDKLKQHPFFASIDWTLLEAKQLPPPYVPTNEILDSIKDDQNNITLCQLLRDAYKSKWCEEFEHPLTPNVSSSTRSNSASLQISEEDQFYFRSWNYINSNLIFN